MKFLGGFLKFLGFFLILIGAIACTALCVLGIMEDLWEPCVVGAGVFLACLFVALGVLGTGIALKHIVKLKKKVEQLEQRLWYAPVTAAPAVPVAAEIEAAPKQPVPVAEPAPLQTTPVSEPVIADAKAPNKTKLIAIIASAVAVVAIILVVVLAGGGKADQQVPALRDEDMQQAVTLPPVDMVEVETEAPVEVETVELPMGSSLSTGFVDMTFDEFIVEADIKKSVTIDRVTRTTGPDPLPGQVYVCLSGTIKATSGTSLPVYDFFNGRFQIGDYAYEVTANDCDILSPDGSTESTIDPLLVYEYRIYTAIPEELQEFIAAGENCSFTFGFYDMFDNQELSYNRSFGDDPIAPCPYQYFIPIH